jgi:hypothetical protein
MSTDPVLNDLRLDIRLTDAPHDRTSCVPPWTTVIAPSLSLDATTTTLAPSGALAMVVFYSGAASSLLATEPESPSSLKVQLRRH